MTQIFRLMSCVLIWHIYLLKVNSFTKFMDSLCKPHGLSKTYYINYRTYTNKTLAYNLYILIGDFIWRLHYCLLLLIRSLKYGLVCDLFRRKESTQIINSITVARKHIIPQSIIVNNQMENSSPFYIRTTINKCSECWRLTWIFWLCDEVNLFTFYCRSSLLCSSG